MKDVTLSGNSSLDEVPPVALFHGVPEDVWRWLHIEGRKHCPFLDRFLPGLTGDPELEAEAVGFSGTSALSEGFQVYELFTSLYEKHAKPLVSQSRVLDFGCGWGRVIRFFLKDVAPENLVGIDTNEGRLAACVESNRWCEFQRCETLPPTGFEADSFDLVFAAFVFSHLSEEAHERWLEEFERLLMPGGVLILTTFQRQLLENFARRPDIIEQFSPREQWLSAYDRGEFCYRAGLESHQHFGTTFIPEGYVRKHWTKLFVVQEYFNAPEWGQNVIVCTKPDDGES